MKFYNKFNIKIFFLIFAFSITHNFVLAISYHDAAKESRELIAELREKFNENENVLGSLDGLEAYIDAYKVMADAALMFGEPTDDLGEHVLEMTAMTLENIEIITKNQQLIEQVTRDLEERENALQNFIDSLKSILTKKNN